MTSLGRVGSDRIVGRGDRTRTARISPRRLVASRPCSLTLTIIALPINRTREPSPRRGRRVFVEIQRESAVPGQRRVGDQPPSSGLFSLYYPHSHLTADPGGCMRTIFGLGLLCLLVAGCGGPEGRPHVPSADGPPPLPRVSRPLVQRGVGEPVPVLSDGRPIELPYASGSFASRVAITWAPR